MGFFYHILDIEEVVLNAPTLDKCTLTVRDQFVQLWTQAVCKHLTGNLGNVVQETHRAVISNFSGVHLLMQQNDQGRVK